MDSYSDLKQTGCCGTVKSSFGSILRQFNSGPNITTNLTSVLIILSHYTRYGVFTAVKIQDEFFYIVTPCSVVVGYQNFGGPCCLSLQGYGHLKRWYPTTTL